MPITSNPTSNDCRFVKSLLQHFTPSPSPKTRQQPRVCLKTNQLPHSCRQCLHMYSQLNSLRQKLRSAHAAYTASHCQDERAFAHIPMLTVRSYRPQRRRHRSAASVDPMSSLKLEIRRNEPVNALFMADDKWVYVKTSDDRRGFIPAKCCQPFAFAAHALAHDNHYCKGFSKFANPKKAGDVKKTTPSPDQKAHYGNEDELDPNDLSLFSVSYLDLSNAPPTHSPVIYDNLNEFKSSASSSASSNPSENNYAYLIDDLITEEITPRKSKKRKRVNPYDTLRRCQRYVAADRREESPIMSADKMRDEKKTRGKDKMLLVRIYKKLKACDTKEEPAHEVYENLDELVTSRKAGFPRLDSEHIYCNSEFF